MVNFCGKCGQELDAKTRLCPQCDQAALAKKKKGKKSVRTVIAVLCCISIIAVGVFGALRFFNNDTVSDTYGEYNSFMEGFTDVLVTDEKSAIEAVDSVSASLGVGSATDELKVSDVQSVEDDSFYRIQQYYHNIPVYGRSIVVSADKNGKATSLTSNYKQVSADIDLEPKASQEAIIKSIKSYINLDDLQDLNITADNLVIYNLDDEDVLAYRLTVNGFGTVIVNADSAEVIQYSPIINNVSAEVTSKDGTVTSTGWQNDNGSYHLYNDEYKIAVFDVKGINTVIDNDGCVHEDFRKYGIDTLYSKNNKFDKDAIILLNDVIDISKYYQNLGYSGFEQVHIAINDSYDNGNNARGGGGEFDGVDCAILLIGENFNFDDKDVVAHEYAHAVTGMLVGWSSSQIENSALDEAYSDIFGTLYENPQNPDWQMVHLSGVIRDLADPSKTNGYDSMSDINESDNYNEYTLSTIVSHSAYLMWNGIDGSDNRKIDATTLSELWYRSMLLLQSNADFSQCRNAVELSARVMLKNEQITEEQYRTVVTAFERVGIENATFTYSETVKNKFDLSVLTDVESGVVNSTNEIVKFKLEVIKMPTIKAGPGIINNEMPELVMEKTEINGRQSLDLKNGTYVLRITDINDTNSISQSIDVKIVVDGDNSNAKDEVVVNTDFTPVIVVMLNDEFPVQETNDEDKTADILLNNLWYNEIQTFNEYRFYEDGTVVENPGDLQRTASYVINGNELTITWSPGVTTNLKYVSKKDDYEWKADLFFYQTVYSELADDEMFFYETDWIDNGGPSDNVMWLRESKDISEDVKETNSDLSGINSTEGPSSGNKLYGIWYSAEAERAYIFDSTGSDIYVTGSGISAVTGTYDVLDFKKKSTYPGGYDLSENMVLTLYSSKQETYCKTYNIELNNNALVLDGYTYNHVSNELQNQFLGTWKGDEGYVEFGEEKCVIVDNSGDKNTYPYYVLSDNLIAINYSGSASGSYRKAQYNINDRQLTLNDEIYWKEGSNNSANVLAGIKDVIVGFWKDDTGLGYNFYENGTYERCIVSMSVDGNITVNAIVESGDYEIVNAQLIKTYPNGYRYMWQDFTYNVQNVTLTTGTEIFEKIESY